MDAEYRMERDIVSQLCCTITSYRHQTHAGYPPVIVTFGKCISLRLNDVLTGCCVIFSKLTRQINLPCSCDSVFQILKQKWRKSLCRILGNAFCYR
jgi:hypothetical protein